MAGFVISWFALKIAAVQSKQYNKGPLILGWFRYRLVCIEVASSEVNEALKIPPFHTRGGFARVFLRLYNSDTVFTIYGHSTSIGIFKGELEHPITILWHGRTKADASQRSCLGSAIL